MSLMFHLTPKNDLKKKAINHGLHLNNYSLPAIQLMERHFFFLFYQQVTKLFRSIEYKHDTLHKIYFNLSDAKQIIYSVMLLGKLFVNKYRTDTV